jgi:hypothetical protein
VRSSVNRIALGTIIGEQPWREMLAETRRRSSTYRLSCVRELISRQRKHAFVLSEEPILLAKISAFAAHPWASGTRDWN